VTIAIGSRYQGGALLCADTEVTHGDALKTHTSKVYLCEEGKSRLAIAYAGSVPFARMFIEECKRIFPDFADKPKIEVRRCISDGLLSFYESRIHRHPHYRQVGGPDFWLIVGVWSEIDGLDLFSTDDTAVNSIETYECVGAGAYLARFLIEKRFNPGWTSGDASSAMEATLQTIKHHVPYCGGASDFVFLGESSGVGHIGLEGVL
jgi:20S proteasome alpha/beta subunit